MRKLLFILQTIIGIALAFKYDYSQIDIFILFLSVVLSFNFYRTIDQWSNYIMTLFVIIYVVMAVDIVALLELSSPGFYKDIIYPNEYYNLAIWGNRLLLTVFSTILIFNFKKRKRFILSEYTVSKDEKNNTFESLFYTCTIVVYILALISKILGISDMSHEASIVLPFHLNGIIDELRSNVYPFIFAIYIYDCFAKNRQINKKYVLYFIVYVVLEILVRSSKGAMLYSFLPALELYAFMGKFTKQGVIKYVVPLLLLFLSFYTVMEVARREGDVSIDNIINIAKDNKAKASEENSNPYIRTFLTGVYYTKLVDMLPDSHLEFDFRRVPALILTNGGATYMTTMIDNVPSSSYHSSGVTGLCDALLWGGYPLGYIVMSLLTLFALWGDQNHFFIRRPLYKVILFYLLYRFVLGRSISFFFDELLLATVMSTVIKIIITKYYYVKFN